eukprot:CAMPEP_0113646468 /NCGR_PEP_ID=MMETSP0017_2-20120614/24548_1 /TAXON_ID=2856 /ORGANISM="Cylindrotheca closterium" /LENGTH=304 /DNA_ID=CAMNT_0000558369 /DNA_START=5 /DNA_END=916 /DNA_ORIENTATION=+ /assembly_acc=CAM_ASM_000147
MTSSPSPARLEPSPSGENPRAAVLAVFSPAANSKKRKNLDNLDGGDDIPFSPPGKSGKGLEIPTEETAQFDSEYWEGRLVTAKALTDTLQLSRKHLKAALVSRDADDKAAKSSKAKHVKFENSYGRNEKTIQDKCEEKARLKSLIESLQEQLKQVTNDFRLLADSHQSEETKNERLRLRDKKVQDEGKANRSRDEAFELTQKVSRMTNSAEVKVKTRWKFLSRDDLLGRFKIPRSYKWLAKLSQKDLRTMRDLMKKYGFPAAQQFDLTKQEKQFILKEVCESLEIPVPSAEPIESEKAKLHDLY